MVMTYPAAVLVGSDVDAASAADVPDSVLPDPARIAKPDGRPGYRIACRRVAVRPGRVGNNRADCTDARQNFRRQWICAGPRAALRRPLRLLAAAECVADSGVIAPAAAVGPWRWCDSVGMPASVATEWRLVGMLRCSNGIASVQANTAFDSP
jgi:hypothetical protein